MRVCPWPNKPIRRLPAEVAIRGQSRLAVNSEVLVPSTHFGMEKRVTAGYPLCAYLVEGRPAELALEEWRMDVEPFRTPHGRKVRVRVYGAALSAAGPKSPRTRGACSRPSARPCLRAISPTATANAAAARAKGETRCPLPRTA